MKSAVAATNAPSSIPSIPEYGAPQKPALEEEEKDLRVELKQKRDCLDATLEVLAKKGLESGRRAAARALAAEHRAAIGRLEAALKGGPAR